MPSPKTVSFAPRWLKCTACLASLSLLFFNVILIAVRPNAYGLTLALPGSVFLFFVGLVTIVRGEPPESPFTLAIDLLRGRAKSTYGPRTTDEEIEKIQKNKRIANCEGCSRSFRSNAPRGIVIPRLWGEQIKCEAGGWGCSCAFRKGMAHGIEIPWLWREGAAGCWDIGATTLVAFSNSLTAAIDLPNVVKIGAAVNIRGRPSGQKGFGIFSRIAAHHPYVFKSKHLTLQFRIDRAR